MPVYWVKKWMLKAKLTLYNVQVGTRIRPLVDKLWTYMQDMGIYVSNYVTEM